MSATWKSLQFAPPLFLSQSPQRSLGFLIFSAFSVNSVRDLMAEIRTKPKSEGKDTGMITETNKKLKLGINGFGRIGKLVVWHNVGRKYFDEIVVNIGRDVGTSLKDITHYMERDSTYGLLRGFLHGHRAEPVIENVDEENRTVTADGTKVKFLQTSRNPVEIDWKAHGVKLVIETTGKFLDPTLQPDDPKGSLRGHFEAGAEKVIVSAPFKIRDKGKEMPVDAVTTIMGINDNDYDPRHHRVIACA